jgi:hypothetical protein
MELERAQPHKASPVYIPGASRSDTTILAEALQKAGYSGFNEQHPLHPLLLGEQSSRFANSLLPDVKQQHIMDGGPPRRQGIHGSTSLRGGGRDPCLLSRL